MAKGVGPVQCLEARGLVVQSPVVAARAAKHSPLFSTSVVHLRRFAPALLPGQYLKVSPFSFVHASLPADTAGLLAFFVIVALTACQVLMKYTCFSFKLCDAYLYCGITAAATLLNGC